MTTSTKPPAPRFTAGQRVRIIANMGGLYAAQIGVVGAIERKRQYRRYGAGYHTYDVTYQDAKGRDKRIVGVREDDLEPTEAVAASAAEPVAPVADEPTPPPQPLAPFRLGQRVTVHPPADGLEDEYPSFTHYPIVGEIVSACQVSAGGVHCYDVRFPRIVRGVSSEWWPPVSIREAHLLPEPSPVGWLASSATSTKREERPLTPLPEPTFSVGELVTVHPHSVLAYETFTRKGAVGTISEIGKPLRGIRRYTVRFEVAHPGGVRESRIREEHLVRAEAPTPPPPEPEPAPVASEPVLTLACARGGRVDCDHEWHPTWDTRYRLCRRCKRVERVAEPTESEARA